VARSVDVSEGRGGHRIVFRRVESRRVRFFGRISFVCQLELAFHASVAASTAAVVVRLHVYEKNLAGCTLDVLGRAAVGRDVSSYAVSIFCSSPLSGR